MPKNKRTINRDSVFRSTSPDTNSPVQTTVPEVQKEAPAHQTAVWLGDKETEWLDSCVREIRSSGWRSVTRSALIRAAIRAAMDHSQNLGGVFEEDELTQRLSSDT